MKLFCGMAIIDVMSICLMTVLIVAIGANNNESDSDTEKKRFSSDLIVITAAIPDADPTKSLTFKEGEATADLRSPSLGVELIRDGKVISSIDPLNGVFAISESSGSAKIMLGITPQDEGLAYVHFFIRDRGTFELSTVNLEFSFRNFPGLDNSVKLPFFPANQYSWLIPLRKCEETEKLIIVNAVDK